MKSPSTRLMVLVAVALTVALSGAPTLAQQPAEDAPAPADQPQAEPKKDDSEAKSEKARRKRFAKLGSGKIRLPAPVGKVYTIEELLERANDVNPELVARKHAELFAELRTDEADWAIFPTINVNSALSIVPARADFDEASSNIEQFLNLEFGPLSNTSIRMVVPIYTFGKIDTAKELADLGVDQAALETYKKRLKIHKQVREAYYSVQLGKHIQALVGDSLEAIRDEIERQNEAREFGDEDVDVIALRQLQLQEADLSRRMIDNSRLIRLPKRALAYLVQLEPDQFDVTPFDDKTDGAELAELTTYQRAAFEHRPDLRLLKAAVAARRAQVDLAFARFMPDIFFGVDFSIGFSTEESPNLVGSISNPDALDALGFDEPLVFDVDPLSDPYEFTRFSFALGLRWQLNPAQQVWKYKQAQARLAETESLREAALGGVDLEMEKLWVEANDHRRKIEINQRGLKAADRWLKQIAIAFESGGAELKEFIKPLSAFYDARLKLLQAQYDYQVAMAKLGQMVGLSDLSVLAKAPEKPQE